MLRVHDRLHAVSCIISNTVMRLPLFLPRINTLSSAVRETFSTLAAGMSIRVLFEDEHLIVCDKPSGMLSVPGKAANVCCIPLHACVNVYVCG
jgi:23S rRNA-/tRNA-specific pseudouridylate synthase